MASSRGTSPASASGTASPIQLTPNSKVKALLASLDKDSDDESVSASPRRRLMTSIAKDPTTKLNTAVQLGHDAGKDTSRIMYSDSDEDDVFRPKGRLAARMQANEGSAQSESTDDEKRRESRRKTLKAKSKSPSPSASANNNEGSDGSDIPVVSRKRKVRVPRRATPASSPEKGPASPGLFVSPRNGRSVTPIGNASDSDELPTAKDLASNARFLALVEKKKEERKAREAEVNKEKALKLAERRRQKELMEEDGIAGDSDEEVERRLTQHAPTRKASKKALEEMHRETQRLSRNQQLAHYATTKKKYTRSGLFAAFNYSDENVQLSKVAHEPSSSPPAPHSDTEMKETPPTSPVAYGDAIDKSVLARDTCLNDNDEEMPILEDVSRIPSSPPSRLDKGKGKAIEEAPSEAELPKKTMFTQRPVRIRPPKVADPQKSAIDDSDSDLEIVVAKTPALKKKLDLIFDRVPAKQAKESHSIHALRMLAHLTSPGKQNVAQGRNKKPSITTAELQLSLQQRARQQAAREREERLEALRAKGVIVQTAEEREKEMAEMDDLLARARQEGEDIMKREKAAAKKERKAAGEVDPLGESSDDEDWEESKAIAGEEVSGSGSDVGEEGSENDASGESEEEEEEAMDMEDEEADGISANPMFDQEAGESDDEEAESELPIDEEMAEDGRTDEEDGEEPLPAPNHRRSRKSNVISDDEDTEDEVNTHKTPRVTQNISPSVNAESPVAPHSVLRSATKTFIPGLPVTGVAGLGLTQIFAGTMDESESQGFASPTQPAPTFKQTDGEKDSMAFLRRLPAPELPPFVATLEEDTQDFEVVPQSQVIPQSQPMESMTQGINLNFSQSQFHGFDSLVEGTQISLFPDATQDVGFQHMTPIKGRFVDGPPSTVGTFVLESTAVPETIDETPIVKKKGKLRRRAPIVNFSDDEENETSKMDVDEEDLDLDITSNAFDVMRKATKKTAVVDEFDKKTSEAKMMIHEQAEESEDEYAGLGGNSDDESGGEEDAYVKEMINDEAGNDANERELAAFFADRERANDEKQVEKLYNDISKGMLRRKRGADYDLSDSDDGGEARRRKKQKDFAKMRKALLADERIGKIAENPKRQAFLRAIEDRGSEDEMDFLDDFAEQEETDSQSQSQNQGESEMIPNSQPVGPPGRKDSEDTANADPRPAAHLRQTKIGKRPSNLSEIRESLSSLIEEPNAVIAAPDSDSESEGELEIEGEDLSSVPVRSKENRDPFALRRTNVSIIDRISLKRQSSSSISNSTRLAFSAASTAPGFKVPALLRRATTNSSITSSTSSGGAASATERMAGGVGMEGVKRGGGKNSGVNYFARESERRAVAVKTEKRREQKLVKSAGVRRKVVGGMLGGGKFE